MRLIAFWTIAITLACSVSSLRTDAAVLTVDTTADDVTKSACDDDVAADCSLRGAIVRANGLGEASTINVPAGVYSLTMSAPCSFQTHQFGTFALNTISLCLHGNITLIGQGADVTIIDANRTDRVVAVSDYTVEIRDVTLRNGTTQTAGSFDGVLQGGGGINNGGTLTLVGSVISGNTAALDGGGIFNGHTLFIARSKIVGNTSAGGGGGIANESYFEVTALSVQDSTIAQNISTSRDGGGIFNFGGAIAITGSTISGNQAAGLGGGIENINNSATIQIVNSTISGNASGSAGGGIEDHSGVLTLNNVTITNNTSATNRAGEGGGIAGGPVTVSNTIIAGNHDANGGAPDCSGTLASTGYNLIQTTTNLFRGFTLTTCNITGDTTGNIIGQDASLGVMVDNGGWTLTHAIGQNSPALNAASGAPPGSGGSACAALDQRGFPRPLGARCDIGAVEYSGAFAVSRIQPAVGGNAGTVTALVSGNGFADGSSVKLTREGAPDVTGVPVKIDNGGSAMSATFDLRNVPVGTWNVVVTSPDSTTRTLANAFTVEAGGSVDVWIDVAPFRLPRHGNTRVTVFYGNRGTVDALGVPLQFSASSQYGLSTLFAVEPPPPQADQILVAYDQVPVNVQPTASGYVTLPLLLPVIPAGFTGALQVQFDIPQPPPTADSSFLANIDVPYFLPFLSDAAVSTLTSGAVSYSSVAFNVVVDPALVPGLRQYTANQLQSVVSSGRNAFVASLGTAPQYFSQTQLVVDTAIVAAWRTLHR